MAKRFAHTDRFINQEFRENGNRIASIEQRLNRLVRNVAVLDGLLAGGGEGQFLQVQPPSGKSSSYAWVESNQGTPWKVVKVA